MSYYVMGIYVCVATVDDTHKLWRNIEPHLRKCLNNVYLREVTGFVPQCTIHFGGFVNNVALKLCDVQGDHSPDNVKFPDISLAVHGTPPRHSAC